MVGVEEDRTSGDMERYTVRDVAEALGISTGAVRNRLSRGTLKSVKERGTVYVLLPADTPRHTERDPGDIPGESDALISEVRAHNATLREQLEAEREANRENRRIIAALTSRIPELPAAPSQEPSEAPETATEQPERVEPRPWWRRMFGG
jgi:hypothetical protein